MNKERILIVDDDKTIRELASVVIQMTGYPTLTAASGNEALELVDQEKPDLVLLDYQMPGMDGLEVLKEIKRRQPQTYVMIFTGQGNEQVAVDFMRAGASDYVLKPFGNKVLRERIEHVLHVRRIEIANRKLTREREKLLSEIESWNRELKKRVMEKSRQLDAAQQEIMQAERLAAIGHISAGLAHDIKNPLNSIGLYAQIIESATGHDSEAYKCAKRIMGEVQRIDTIIHHLLDTSRREQRENRIAPVIETVNECLDLFTSQLEVKEVLLRCEIAPALADARFDRVELGQILSNMLSNSITAVEHGGEIDLSIHAFDDHLHIHVTDNGCGIDEGNRHKIFDPFFTTRPGGSGFGLSTVRRIVKGYGGSIDLTSKPGNGTRFDIRIPLGTHQQSALQ